jgi:hypothetical protein
MSGHYLGRSSAASVITRSCLLSWFALGRNSGTDGTDPNSARTYRMPLVNQQHDVRSLITIGSVPEFLLI